MHGVSKINLSRCLMLFSDHRLQNLVKNLIGPFAFFLQVQVCAPASEGQAGVKYCKVRS